MGRFCPFDIVMFSIYFFFFNFQTEIFKKLNISNITKNENNLQIPWMKIICNTHAFIFIITLRMLWNLCITFRFTIRFFLMNCTSMVCLHMNTWRTSNALRSMSSNYFKNILTYLYDIKCKEIGKLFQMQKV